MLRNSIIRRIALRPKSLFTDDCSLITGFALCAMRQTWQATLCRIMSLLVVFSAAGAQEWVNITPIEGEMPPARRNAAAIYDSTRDRMIVFGGRNPQALNDVWAFSLANHTWQDLSPSSGPAPSPRYTANAIFDPVQDQMIVWAGLGSSQFNDVWGFDLDSNTWSEYQPPEPRPNRRYGTAAVYDPVMKHLVTFAGFTDQGRFQDTWRFDIDQVTWENVTPDVDNPPQRCLHSAAYDSRNHRFIIYGGQQSGALDDIWAFDLTNNSWQELTPDDSPQGRWFPSLIYEEVGNRVILFGGDTGSGDLNDVWAFDLMSETWSPVSTEAAPPSARDGAAAIYAEDGNRLILFGGRDAQERNDVWSLNDLSGPLSDAGQSDVLPAAFKLHGAFPNPLNPSTSIVYELPHPGLVTVKVFDLQGRRVKMVDHSYKTHGVHRAVWSGDNDANIPVTSGVYFLIIQYRNEYQSGKVLVLK